METAEEVDGDEEACDRCGDFAELTSYGESWLCTPCVGRLPAIQREPPTFVNVLVGSLTVFVRILPSAWAITLVVNLPYTVITSLYPAQGTLGVVLPGLAYGSTVGMLATGAILLMAHRAIQGEKAEPVHCLNIAAKRWVRVFSANLVAGLLVAAYSLLFLVPGIVKNFSLFLALPIVLHEDVSTTEALDESTRRMRGHRAVAFAAACALLPIAGLYAALTFGLVLLERSLGSSFALTLTMQIAQEPLTILALCLPAVLYAKRLWPG